MVCEQVCSKLITDYKLTTPRTVARAMVLSVGRRLCSGGPSDDDMRHSSDILIWLAICNHPPLRLLDTPRVTFKIHKHPTRNFQNLPIPAHNSPAQLSIMLPSNCQYFSKLNLQKAPCQCLPKINFY